MKKIIYSSLIALALWMSYKICFPEYRITHFYAKNSHGKCVITSIERTPFLGPTTTYFTEGNFEKKEIPSSYLKPYSKGFSGCWTADLMFRNDTAYYLEGSGTTAIKRDFQKLVFKTSSFTDYNEMQKSAAMSDEMKNDKSGNVYHFSEYPAGR